MKQKLKKILAISLAYLLLSRSIFVYSTYQEAFCASSTLQIASPKIQLISNTSYIDVLENHTYTNEFQVTNFDETGVTDVELIYQIVVNITPSNSPIAWQLYQIQSDGSEILVNSTHSFLLSNTQTQTDQYKLAIAYDLSGNSLEAPAEFSITLNVTQKGSV